VRLLSAGLGVLALACSTTSTIYRVKGIPLEVDVLGGSPTTIFVSEKGQEYEIPREDIASIDYPGNVHTAAGAVLAGYGVLNIAVGLPKCAEPGENNAAFCAGVFLPAIVGVAIMVWGLVVNQEQTDAVQDHSRRSRRLPKPHLPVPPQSSDVPDDSDDEEPVRRRQPAPPAVYLEDDPPQVDLEEDPAGAPRAKPVEPFVPHPPASSVPPPASPPPPASAAPPASNPPPPSKSFPVDK